MARWYKDGNLLLGVRVANWAGDTGGAATSFPADTLAVVASDTSKRVFHIWAYSPEGGDLVLTIPFSEVATEPGTVYPTGRLDPMGAPVVFYHGGQIKFVVKLWDGGQGTGTPLARVYTNIFFR
jgi:hypothetical protein